MEELGYPRFAAHANDIGAVITCYIVRDYPRHLIGYHTLMPHFPSPSFGTGTSAMSEAERRFAACNEQWEREEGGYNLIQETKPQTLAYGLNDSPSGLAAWIIEKWRSWGAMDGHIKKTGDGASMCESPAPIAVIFLCYTDEEMDRVPCRAQGQGKLSPLMMAAAMKR